MAVVAKVKPVYDYLDFFHFAKNEEILIFLSKLLLLSFGTLSFTQYHLFEVELLIWGLKLPLRHLF